MQKTVLWKCIGYHLLFWLVLGCVWYYLRYQDYSTTATAVRVTFVKVVDLALLIYLTNYVLIPRLLYPKRYLLFFTLFIGLILGSSLLKMQVLGYVMGNPGVYTITSASWKLRFYDNVIPHFFLVTAGAAVKLIYDYMRLQQRLVEVAKEKAETELAFLKSQINPHFLFNSLNAVYFLIDKHNKDARQALHTFSDMLRYQLYEANGKKIPIEKETGYLQDYVAMQQLRKNDDLEVKFSADKEVKHFSIEPLLLLPFVENAFKHCAVFAGKKSCIDIAMNYRSGLFVFKVTNSAGGEKTTEAGSGIGIANVRRRLELLYPGRHELRVSREDDVYVAKLVIEVV